MPEEKKGKTKKEDFEKVAGGVTDDLWFDGGLNEYRTCAKCGKSYLTRRGTMHLNDWCWECLLWKSK